MVLPSIVCKPSNWKMAYHPFPAVHALSSACVLWLVAYIANNMDQDQTAPFGAV